MKQVGILNISNGAAQAIIRMLTSQNIKVYLADLYPSYHSIQSFLVFKDTLSNKQQRLIDGCQLQCISDLKQFINKHEQLVFVNHNYLPPVISSYFLNQHALLLVSRDQKVLNLMVYEHLDFNDDRQLEQCEMQLMMADKLDNVVNIEAELLFGQDHSYFNQIIQMVLNQKFSIMINKYDTLNKYLSPVDSADLSQGIYQLIQNEPNHKSYLFTGGATYSIYQIIQIISHQLQSNQISSYRSCLQASLNSFDRNILLMFDSLELQTQNKGDLLDLGIQPKKLEQFKLMQQYLDPNKDFLGQYMFY